MHSFSVSLFTTNHQRPSIHRPVDIIIIIIIVVVIYDLLVDYLRTVLQHITAALAKERLIALTINDYRAYNVTSLLFLRVTCPCSLRTYATLKFIRSS